MATPEPTYPDRIVDLCPPDQPAHAVLVRLPDDPASEWVIYAVPVHTALLDDETATPRQVALDVAAEARATAERVTYAAVLERRRG